MLLKDCIAKLLDVEHLEVENIEHSSHTIDSQEAKKHLREFRMHALVAEIPEFEACLTMLKNWEVYILNAFDCPYSNGFTEGVNNTIKVIKRIAYGYRNFRNFRSRILATVNT